MKGIGLIVAVAILGLATGLYLSRKPWQDLKEQQHSVVEAKNDMKAAERERAKLIQEEARLQSPVGREQTARMRGYRRPDETPAGEIK